MQVWRFQIRAHLARSHAEGTPECHREVRVACKAQVKGERANAPLAFAQAIERERHPQLIAKAVQAQFPCACETGALNERPSNALPWQ